MTEGRHEAYLLQSLFYSKEKNIRYGTKAVATETGTQGYLSTWEQYYCKWQHTYSLSSYRCPGCAVVQTVKMENV